MMTRPRLALALAAALMQTPAHTGAVALHADELAARPARVDTLYQAALQVQGRTSPTPPLNDVIVDRLPARLPDQVDITPEGERLTFVMQDPADETFGATFQPVPPPVRAQLRLPDGRGLIVAEVDNDGPAAQVGLRRLDIITSLADQPVTSAADLEKHLEAAGEKDVPLIVLRQGRPVTLRVRPVRRVTFGPVEKESTEYVLGVLLGTLDVALRSQLGLGDKAGLIVNEVVPDSPAARVGVKVHDILLKYDDTAISNQTELAELVNEGKGKSANLTLLREGKEISVGVTPERGTVKTAARPRNVLRYFSVNPPGSNPLWRTQPFSVPLSNAYRPGPPVGPNAMPLIPGRPNVGPARPDAQIEALKKQLDELKRTVETLRKEKDGASGGTPDRGRDDLPN